MMLQEMLTTKPKGARAVLCASLLVLLGSCSEPPTSIGAAGSGKTADPKRSAIAVAQEAQGATGGFYSSVMGFLTPNTPELGLMREGEIVLWRTILEPGNLRGVQNALRRFCRDEIGGRISEHHHELGETIAFCADRDGIRRFEYRYHTQMLTRNTRGHFLTVGEGPAQEMSARHFESWQKHMIAAGERAFARAEQQQRVEVARQMAAADYEAAQFGDARCRPLRDGTLVLAIVENKADGRYQLRIASGTYRLPDGLVKGDVIWGDALLWRRC